MFSIIRKSQIYKEPLLCLSVLKDILVNNLKIKEEDNKIVLNYKDGLQIKHSFEDIKLDDYYPNSKSYIKNNILNMEFGNGNKFKFPFKDEKELLDMCKEEILLDKEFIYAKYENHKDLVDLLKKNNLL